MPIHIPRSNFHSEVENILKNIKKDKKCGNIYLAYGWTQIPWIELRADNITIPIAPPKNYSPYTSWNDFMKNYIEAQVGVIAEELKITVLVLTRNNELAPLNRNIAEESM